MRITKNGVMTQDTRLKTQDLIKVGCDVSGCVKLLTLEMQKRRQPSVRCSAFTVTVAFVSFALHSKGLTWIEAAWLHKALATLAGRQRRCKAR
jgi:hypothetical protein